jgi:hypothetical protein
MNEDELADLPISEDDEVDLASLTDDDIVDDDIETPLPIDEFAEDYDEDSGGVNFHSEDTDKNY